MDIERYLSLDSLTTSCFLFGCRQVGKTWLLKKTVDFDIYLDLLKKSELIRYTKSPEILFAEIAALNKRKPLIIIDEIQKAFGLLDEVHRAIESPMRPKFILTGSSASCIETESGSTLTPTISAAMCRPSGCCAKGVMAVAPRFPTLPCRRS